MNLKTIFTKTNILIFFFLLLLGALAVFFYQKAHEGGPEQFSETQQEQKSSQEEIQGIKEEIGFEAYSDEDLQKQLEQLQKLRQR